MIRRMKEARKSLRAMLDEKARARKDLKSNLPPFIRVVAVVVPRRTSAFGGVDHGSTGRCLLESRGPGNEIVHQLVWFSGHWRAAEGVRVFGRVYSPARLHLIDRHGLDAGYRFRIEGGRITAPRIMEASSEIDRFFGAGAAALVEIGSTIVVTAPDTAPRRP